MPRAAAPPALPYSRRCHSLSSHSNCVAGVTRRIVARHQVASQSPCSATAPSHAPMPCSPMRRAAPMTAMRAQPGLLTLLCHHRTAAHEKNFVFFSKDCTCLSTLFAHKRERARVRECECDSDRVSVSVTVTVTATATVTVTLTVTLTATASESESEYEYRMALRSYCRSWHATSGAVGVMCHVEHVIHT